MRKFCRDICESYRAYKDEHNKGYYSEGCKRCIECNLFLEYEGLICPCCMRVLRSKPHNTRSKSRLLKQYARI